MGDRLFMRIPFLVYPRKIERHIEGRSEWGIELKVLMLGGPRGWDIAHIWSPISVPRVGH
jgi:hypothetical protein